MSDRPPVNVDALWSMVAHIAKRLIEMGYVAKPKEEPHGQP